MLKGIVPAKAAKMAAKSVTLMTEKLINIKVRGESGSAGRLPSARFVGGVRRRRRRLRRKAGSELSRNCFHSRFRLAAAGSTRVKGC